MTKRVTFLLADLKLGGIQSMVDSLARGLERAKFDPSFVVFDAEGVLADALRRDGYEVRFVPRRPGFDRSLPARLREAFRALGTNIVHAHNRTALFYGVLARGFSRTPGLIYTEHDRAFPEALKVRLLHAILSRRVDAVAAVCSFVRDAIVATERFPADRTHVIVNGVKDPGAPADRDSIRRGVRAEFQLDPQRPFVLAVGHLTPVKDHALLLDAIATLPPEQRPNLVIAGDGELRGALEAQRTRLGLDSRVHLPGYRRDVDRLLLACDVLAMSSRSEGLSIALIEAAARGVPIVATRVGGNPEVVVDGESGVLVPHGDPKAFGGALRRLLCDPQRLHAMGLRGRAEFEHKFLLPTMIDRYQELYMHAARLPI